MRDFIVLSLAALAAGAINAVAGGGTLLTFPALTSVLGTAAAAKVLANVTSTTALVPGSLAGAWGYRTEIRRLPAWGWWLLAPSFLGGLAGSILLVMLPPEIFESLVPWLILTAALLFALQPRLTRGTSARRGALPSAKVSASRGAAHGPRNLAPVMLLQFLVAVYGGYFGAGIGILMLATLGFMGLEDIHEMNALKNLLGAAINGVSVAVFICERAIHWRLALLMAVAAILGGYMGARAARRLNRALVRQIIVAIGISLATYYFYSQWRPLMRA